MPEPAQTAAPPRPRPPRRKRGSPPTPAAVIAELRARGEGADLEAPPRPARYEPGDRLELTLTGVDPPIEAAGVFVVDRFVGGGFAGQVYRVRLESLRSAGGDTPVGLTIGGIYAIKILIPPGRFALRFRNALYRVAFQAPFLPQLHRGAARAGVLWQKAIRHAARVRLRSADCVADTFATFFDARMRSFGEVNEWVEGRMWRFAVDEQLYRRRRAMRGGEETIRRHPAGEFLAKKHFMRRFTRLLDEIGAGEFRRQYEWSTCKSQPNMLKRTAAGRDPFTGLTAIDFRAGLALLPFLPMSPGDFGLILRGISRGRFVQFDRGDQRRLDRFAGSSPSPFRGHERLLEELRRSEQEYRDARPDLSRQPLRFLFSRRLRRSIRNANIETWIRRGLVTEDRARPLRRTGPAYALYFVLGAIPGLGRFVRRLWGDPAYGRHVGRILSSHSYAGRWMTALRAEVVLRWYRGMRVSERHALRLANNGALFWLERILVGWIPIRGIHKLVFEPATVWRGFVVSVGFIWRFYRDNEFREKWLRAEIEDGREEGMLTDEEADHIAGRVKEPYIQKYLQSLAVHFCTLPATQIVAFLVGLIMGHRVYTEGGSAAEAGGVFAGIVVFFQISPVSPGSLLRGLYVVYAMIRDRNIRDYAWALPISFLHYVGYLAFPIQMVIKYPVLSRFMAGRWATHLVRLVPVFGEHGALLEHGVFDTFFNVPVSIRAGLRRIRRRPAEESAG